MAQQKSEVIIQIDLGSFKDRLTGLVETGKIQCK